ncbi:hypothetical protein RBU60_00410 [Mesonia sp. MT50]|uniref:DUF3185 domain-containing protein n=1 Tax=Mesonia profundi TaxID=3070998 RepID=A0ABU0ZX32_9FLAO|nr:hypothetical protein [Mesonia profundi]MDQ7916025.1 hypothetical protein [Mesonia profundi]
MQNTLKVVLLILGMALIGYGLYTVIFPHISLEDGVSHISAKADQTQSFAMVCLGILTLVCGLAFKKK